MSDDESTFQDLVKRLGGEGGVDDGEISLYDITNTVSVMSEVTSLMAGFICRYVDNQDLEFPADLVGKVFDLFTLSGEVSDVLSDYLEGVDDDEDEDECEHNGEDVEDDDKS